MPQDREEESRTTHSAVPRASCPKYPKKSGLGESSATRSEEHTSELQPTSPLFPSPPLFRSQCLKIAKKNLARLIQLYRERRVQNIRRSQALVNPARRDRKSTRLNSSQHLPSSPPRRSSDLNASRSRRRISHDSFSCTASVVSKISEEVRPW